jgi:hypothetical protein
VNDTAKLFVFQNVECPFVDKWKKYFI